MNKKLLMVVLLITSSAFGANSSFETIQCDNGMQTPSYPGTQDVANVQVQT